MQWWLVVVMLQTMRELAASSPPPSPVLMLEKPRRCTYERAYGMQGAHCSKLDLHFVPNSLKSNIQILDASFNRIRELHSTTFQKYPGIRYLYLSENMIQSIDSTAFEPLTSLETLDLSINALTTIPSFILNLPSLRKLYISDNKLTSLNEDLKEMTKPIQAPLNFISLAKCRLREFPDFGVMPDLEHMNMSANEIKSLNPKDFASLCSLKLLDLTSNSYSHQNVCSNREMAAWFRDKEVNILPDMYIIFNPDNDETQSCSPITFDEEDAQTYLECKSSIKIKKQEKVVRKTWMIIGGSVGGVLVICIIIAFWLHRRNVKQTRRNIKKTNITKGDIAENNSSNLLSDVS